MLREYAIEPECLKDWQNFRYLIESFGVSQGRLISRFPKYWQNLVYQACSGYSFREKGMLTHELERLKKRGLIKSGRSFDGTKSWYDNALIQQQGNQPFHAIIAESLAEPNSCVLQPDKISGQNPLWTTKRQDDCPRTLEALGNATEKFLQISDRIIFVDKYFTPMKSRWQEMLIYLIELATDCRTILPKFEYHTQFDFKEDQSTQNFRDECFRSLSPLLYKNISLKVVRWNGNYFHARSILSEKGGIDIDWGLDVGQTGQTTRITLMDDDVWERNWNKFKTELQESEHIDFVEIHGSREG